MKTALRSNVSDAPASFVGRARELASLEATMREGARLVTVFGAPGIGKTRLAQRFALMWRRVFEDAGGAWFCDLTPARDLAALCDIIRDALGGAPLPTDPEAALLALAEASTSRGP